MEHSRPRLCPSSLAGEAPAAPWLGDRHLAAGETNTRSSHPRYPRPKLNLSAHRELLFEDDMGGYTTPQERATGHAFSDAGTESQRGRPYHVMTW